MQIVRYNPKHGYSHVDNGVVRGELRGPSPCMVDVKGYIPMRTQIDRLMSSGERLEEYRRLLYSGITHGAYDSLAEDFEGEVSPIYDPDFLPSTDMLRVEAMLSEKRAKQVAMAREADKRSESELSTSFSGSPSGSNEKAQSVGEPEKTGVSTQTNDKS